MITLVITNGDGSPYWVEHFPNQDTCDRWLKEEKTRPYWKKDFKTSIQSVADPAATAPQPANSDRDAARDFLKSLDQKYLSGSDQCAEAIVHIVKYLGLN